MRSKGYKISGDIAIAIGLIGITIVISYDKICLFLKNFLEIGTQDMESFFITGILTCLGGILLVVVINLYRNRRTAKKRHATNRFLTFIMRLRPKKQNRPIIAQLSSEVDENIRHLRVFWRDYQRAKNGSNRPEDFSEIARAEIKRSQIFPIEFRLSLPNWYQVIAEQDSLFSILPKKMAMRVEQFHLNLNNITKTYDQIKDIVKKQYNSNQLLKLRTQWEVLVLEVLERGNPLKVI